MIDLKPWYLSRTIWASIAGILLSAAGFMGVETGALTSDSITEALLQVATALAGVMALYGRLAATSRIR